MGYEDQFESGSSGGPLAPRFQGNARFEVIGNLGTGGMGLVCEAFDRERGMRVAVKSLKQLSAAQLLRLKREFRALRDVRHPNLVSLGELFEENGLWFFTMERIHGTDLLSWVGAERRVGKEPGDAATTSGERPKYVPGRGGMADTGERPSVTSAAYDEARLRDAIAQLAVGLAALHRRGIVHRDVKPSNVLVDASGRVVLLDFGVVAEIHRELAETEIVGTAAYMAPEQARGGVPTEAADWYAVGVLLYRIFAGVLPIDANTRVEMLARKVETDPPPLERLAPSAPKELVGLATRLLARHPDDRPREPEILRVLGVDRLPNASSIHDTPPHRFVGRREELRELIDAWSTSRVHGCVTMLIEGASGVGKTSLVDEALDQLRDESPSLWVLRSRCHERESVPYNALDGLVDQLGQALQEISTAVRQRIGRGFDIEALVQLFPTLRVARGLGAHAEVNPDPVRRREAAFTALKGVLRRVARRYPLALVLDDLHWMDADSQALLQELCRGSDAPEALVVLIRRPMPRAKDPLGRMADRHLSIGELPSSDALALIDVLKTVYGTAEVDLRSAVENVGGHPLLLDELVRHVGTAGKAPTHDLDSAIRHRIAELPRASRDLLELLGVAGAPISQELAARAMYLSPEEFAKALAPLEVGRLVRMSGMRRVDTLETYHDRFREALFDGLSVSERGELHRRLAEAGEATHAPARMVALHWAGAGEPERSARHYREAADAAASTLAFQQAAHLYRQVLALSPGTTEEERETRTRLASALFFAGRPREAAEAFLEAVRTGEPAREEYLDLMRRAATAFLHGGYLVEGRDTMRELLEADGIALPLTSPSTFFRILHDEIVLKVSSLRWKKRDPDELTPAARRRLETYWAAGSGLSLVDSVVAAHFTWRAARVCRATGDPLLIARSFGAASMASVATGKHRLGVKLARAAREAAEAADTAHARFYADGAELTHSYLGLNDWSATLDIAKRAEANWADSDGMVGHHAGDVLEQFLCWAYAYLGQLEELERRVPERIRAAQRAGDLFMEVTMRCWYFHQDVARDDSARARRDIREAIAAWPARGFTNQRILAQRSLSFLALYDGEVGDPSLDQGWRAFHAAFASRLEMRRTEALSLETGLALARAAQARHAGDEAAVRAQIRMATERLRGLARIPIRLAHLRRRIGLATLAHARGRDEDAIEGLRGSLRSASRMDSPSIAASVQRQLGRLVGGDEGADLIASADADLADRGIRRPDRYAEMEVPGFDDLP